MDRNTGNFPEILPQEGGEAWARALRVHGDVANDNGQPQGRRKGDTPAGTVLHVSIAPRLVS